MTTAPLSLRVECDPGDPDEETPRRFFIGDRSIQIDEVIDRWLAPDYGYFKVRAGENDIYILRHDLVTQQWELTLFQSGKLDRSRLPPTGTERIQ